MMSSDWFTDASRYYAEFRPGLPDVVWQSLIDRLDCGESPGLLIDLGAGTGEVAVAIGARFKRTVLIEPDVAMMRAARTRLSAIKELAVEFVECAAEEYQHDNRPEPGLVTISRAFHWMDQARVLRSISTWGSEETLLAILDDSSLWNCTDPWAAEVRTLIQDHLGAERRAGTGRFKVPARSYEDILADAGYRDVGAASWEFVREWEPDAVEGYLYSTSYASRSLFGDRLAAFQSDLRELLRRRSQTDNGLVEHTRVRLVTAHLPARVASHDHS